MHLLFVLYVNDLLQKFVTLMYSDGTVLYFTAVMGLGLFPRAYNATVLETFRSNDAEGNENVK